MRRASGDPPGDAGWDLRAEAPAKLNLGLEIVRRRADGFHDLRTIFQAIDLHDDLTVRERGRAGVSLVVTGPEAPAVPSGPENLIVRAGEELARRRAPGRGVEIRLTKRIPVGAGLGGGSSDAAATLLALEALWSLDPDPRERARLALELGSDVPFFLVGGTALGEGRGERLTRVHAPPPCGWILAVPEFRVSTAEAFRRVSPRLTGPKQRINILLTAFEKGDYDRFFENLGNDLEAGVVRIQPRLAGIRLELLDHGALAVGLTGSGSALYALTRSQGAANKLLNKGFEAPGCALTSVSPVGFGARVVPWTR
jgi:4-diphosphocytidyl-2-C-methyl-D-erythritol kinase